MAAGTVPAVALRDGARIPQLGFGVFQIPPEETQAAVEEALAAGYRHVDTAAAYGNEAEVAAAIAASGLQRTEVYVTTKLWNSDQGYESTLRACEASLRRLGGEWIDLYLIHWPLPAADLYLETWRAFERLREEGAVRSIGVSNFRVEDLERLQREAGEMPVLNQIELHPLLQQAELREWHREHGVVTEAWSPLGQGTLLDDETIATVAAHHRRSPAQVLLRWQLQLGNVTIPRSVTPARIRENLDLFDFALSEDDMAAIARLDSGQRQGPDPSSFGRA